jgi:hypothetical protein
MDNRAQTCNSHDDGAEESLTNLETKHATSTPCSCPADQDHIRCTETLLILLLGLVVCVAATTAQSYWIDEAVTVRKTVSPNLVRLWHDLRVEGNANLQVPLYFVFAWAWEKVTGLGEFGMRAGNWVWFLLGLITAVRALSAKRLLCWGILLALLISPFAWYYIDEARPYSLQLAASLMVFGALYRVLSWNDLTQARTSWVALLCLGSLLLATSGLLAMVWLGGFLAAAGLCKPATHWLQLLRAYPKSLGVTAMLLAAMAAFYLWSLGIGARATYGQTTVATLLSIPYELLGFSGLGPGRLELRDVGPRALLPWAPILTAYGLALLFLLLKAWRWVALETSFRTRLSWAVSLFLVMAFVVGMSIHSQFRVLGRHCMPLLPLCLAFVGAGIADNLARKHALARVLLVTFLALSATSCLELRLAKRHSKDDYRSAVALAQSALSRGKLVWWNADLEGAAIYGLQMERATNTPSSAVVVVNPDPRFDFGMSKPDLVITSRPDKYDAYGAVADYLRKARFQETAAFQGFTVWQKTVD